MMPAQFKSTETYGELEGKFGRFQWMKVEEEDSTKWLVRWMDMNMNIATFSTESMAEWCAEGLAWGYVKMETLVEKEKKRKKREDRKVNMR